MLCGLPTFTLRACRNGRTRWQAAHVSAVPEHLNESEESIKTQRYVHVSFYEDNSLSALFHHSQWHSPLARLDDAQKLAWVKSQLIGDNQAFSTPFGVRQLVYADHAASGRSLSFIESFIARCVLPFYGNTHTDDSYVGRTTSRMVRQAEEYIKESLGGSEEDALLMCGWGCTAAIKRLQEVMGIAVPSILRGSVLNMMQEMADTERWLVFVGPYEHHSNLLSWRQSLAEVREIPANEEGRIDLERLEEELRAAEEAGRQRKLGAFSACSNVTGLLTDTRAITRLLHRYGALACFDFAAGASHMCLEMRSFEDDGYDAIVVSPHKLLGGPGTPGILLMKKSLYKLEKHPPSTCGGGTVAYVNGFNDEDTLYHEKIEEREEGGTPPIIGKVRCAFAFWLKEAVGLSLIRKRENLFVEKVMERLGSIPNVKVLGGHPSIRVAPIFSILITTIEQAARETSGIAKPLHGRFVVTLLNDLFGIQARGGCACAGPYGHLLLNIGKELSLAIRNAIQKGYEGLKPGWARISLCYSMTHEEVDYILSAISFLGSYGHRFLVLYDFDWLSGNWTFSEEKACGVFMTQKRGYYLNGDEKSLQLALPECEKAWSQRERFCHCLQHARALSHLLPCCPPPKLVPLDIDQKLITFQI